MSVEMQEDALFTIRYSVPFSELPTKGWARVYCLNQDTKTICIKEVQFAELFSKQTFDIFASDNFRNDVAALGFVPYPMWTFYIMLPDELRNGLRRVIDACRGLAPTSLEDLDLAIQATTGISLLAAPTMRELLLFIALQCYTITSRATPRQAHTIATITAAGPPSEGIYTAEFRAYIDEGADGLSFLHPRAEIALLSGGWRQPKQKSLMALWGLAEDAFMKDSQLENDAQGLLHLLIELQCIRISPEPNITAIGLIWWLALQGSVTMMRLVLGDHGVLSKESLGAESCADVLFQAVAVASDDKYPNRQPMLAYLLRDIEIDPNILGRHAVEAKPGQGKIRQTALHVAIVNEETITMNLLLNEGASLDIKDEMGRTPSERQPFFFLRDQNLSYDSNHLHDQLWNRLLGRSCSLSAFRSEVLG